MAVDSTLLFREVDLVTQSGETATHYNLEVQVKAGDKWLKPFRLDHWAQERDYEKNWGEVSDITFLIGAGTYAYQIIPNREALLVDLKFIPLTPNTTSQRSDIPARVYRYRGILMNQDNPSLAGKNSQTTNEEALNRGMTTVQLQLMDETNYRMRMVPTGGLLRNMSPIEAVYTLLTESIAKVGGNNEQKILGINVVEGFNQEKRKVIQIPHGLNITKAVGYIQEQEGGIYPTGCGRFIQDQYWWVFSLYDVKRVNKALKTLKVYNVPSNRLDGSEHTYRTTNNQVIVLATGDASSLDPSLFSKLNLGNGVRFADARKLLDGFGVMKDNRMLIDRATNLFEAVGSKLTGEFNNVAWAKDGATSNPFKHYSEMAAKQGQFVVMTWRYGDSDLLKPGMPVEFSTISDDLMVTYRGILLGVHEQRIPSDAGAVTSRYPSSIELRLFISTEEDIS